MTLGEFLEQVRGVPEETVLCIAEVDEAFGANLARVELINDAKAHRDDAADTEAVELANGKDKASC
jgi:hypothetical protein